MFSVLLNQDQHVLDWVNLSYCPCCQEGRGEGPKGDACCPVGERPLQYVHVRGKELDLNREGWDTSASSQGARR